MAINLRSARLSRTQLTPLRPLLPLILAPLRRPTPCLPAPKLPPHRKVPTDKRDIRDVVYPQPDAERCRALEWRWEGQGRTEAVREGARVRSRGGRMGSGVRVCRGGVKEGHLVTEGRDRTPGWTASAAGRRYLLPRFSSFPLFRSSWRCDSCLRRAAFPSSYC